MTLGSHPPRSPCGGIGEPALRPDAPAKTDGTFAFSNDCSVEGMLHGAILRSPHASARILAIDGSAARALPGVACVVTADDVPGDATFGILVADQPVFARDVVRYEGEPIAAVAAVDPAVARRARDAIVVEYEVLEPRVDPEVAVGGTAPSSHPDGDVFRHQQVVCGDPDVVGAVAVEGTYVSALQDQAFLGPEAALAIPDADGAGVELLVATQSLHDDRRQIAASLGLPPDRVRVTLCGIGGAFGGREELSLQIPVALLALRAGRPVRMIATRAESFVAHPHRHPARIWMRHHADADGRLVNLEARIVLDGGAYANTSPAVLFNAVSLAQGPYRCPNGRIDGWVVRTNNPPCGAMRGFGVPQVCFAAESQMDLLAAACGLDPLEVRLRNALVAGDALLTGQVLTGTVPVAECIREVAALALPPPADPRDVRARPGGTGLAADPAAVVRGVGYGVAMKNLMYSEGTDDFVTARCRLVDGVVTLTLATCEVGQGFVAVAAQVARSVLGDVEVVLAPADTRIGPAGSSSASRTTWMAGGAIQAACREVRDRRVAGAREPIEATVELHHRPTEAPDERGQGDAHVAFAFVAHRAVVDVDVDLGLVKVVQVATAQDVGTVVNPLGVIGQVEGGIAQGLGLAVMEQLHVERGVIANRTFADYLIPTAADAPEVVVHLVERPEPASPLGAKGVGELPCISVTPAVVAALRAATGRAIIRVPVRPDDLAP